MKRIVSVISLLLVASFGESHAEEAPKETGDKPIIIKASRFAFSPSKIILKKGQRVTLEISATDRLHGFSIPELGIRTDAMVGQTSSLSFTPNKKGKLIFFCDIICGSGHEEMAGEIEVVD